MQVFQCGFVFSFLVVDKVEEVVDPPGFKVYTAFFVFVTDVPEQLGTLYNPSEISCGLTTLQASIRLA